MKKMLFNLSNLNRLVLIELKIHKIQKFNYFTYPCPRKLREIVKLTMFEKENTTRIKEIWNTYHSEKDRTISDVLESNLMDSIQNK